MLRRRLSRIFQSPHFLPPPSFFPLCLPRPVTVQTHEREEKRRGGGHTLNEMDVENKEEEELPVLLALRGVRKAESTKLWYNSVH